MPRLIFKCNYIKGGSERAASHLGNYVRYMATREGAQRISPARADFPATKKQQEMVEQLLRDYPLSRGLFEYDDYIAAPTRGNASEFITRALEDNYDQISKRENYISYIASRPRAQRMGTHALFTRPDEQVSLPHIANEVAHHSGNVWLPIISLRREDAARLGYDNAKNWQSLIDGYAPEMAQAMKIPLDQFRWYAAFHNEGHHPHLHMVCYSADGRSGYLTRDGIAKIKSDWAKEIFRQELHELYMQQTQQRDQLVREAGDVIRQMKNGTLDNPRVEQLMLELAGRLKQTGGKKQYGYLKAPLKAIVDEVVDELSKDSRVSRAYGLWYELREDVLGTYREDMPQRLRLSEQKEFKRIKNLVIEEALLLGELTEVFQAEDTQEQGERNVPHPEDEEPEKSTGHDRREQYKRVRRVLDDDHPQAQDLAWAVEWLKKAAEQNNSYAQYQLGKLRLQGEKVPKDVSEAVRLFTAAAEQGNQYAQYTLGKLYLLGKDVPPDRNTAIRWLTLSAAQGNERAKFFLNHMAQWQGPSLLSCATRLLCRLSELFEEQTPRRLNRAICFTDKKLRRKIMKKKIALGHRADDYEMRGF